MTNTSKNFQPKVGSRKTLEYAYVEPGKYRPSNQEKWEADFKWHADMDMKQQDRQNIGRDTTHIPSNTASGPDNEV